ncbi:hypothetical protein Pmar_PMAR001248 [Perkinsus marinus ATCC 50983]|uniref:Peptidase M14 domain-containing protein n=1 Tax=Perkinsus marinus (strain ATCC 50983 / TXsc) TaxID=423536 RepID=C5KTA0_PERM5|nr:hypothetical protein Pmar_PMAR001248 [Perkinsus marinus ATCC 50983]EER12450.1 hypothetical protein Pmar_PMAR001248 [Perkinsus marinus ATCC 50983]|eukprot:XP_002780655.1 hypothetical protein Pmar_PMAR001248 [Perkinsus marinus ATCC 50983]
MRVKILATFNVTNLRKRKSLYNMGMRPFTLHSGNLAEGWVSDRCTDVSYTQSAQSPEQAPADGDSAINYILSFRYCFSSHGLNETVVFAMAPPLTYTTLVSHLRMLRDNHTENDLWQVATGNNRPVHGSSLGASGDLSWGHACASPSGLGLHTGSIELAQPFEIYGASTSTQAPFRVGLVAVFVIIARQHPGETVGSWICLGLLHWLLSDTARQLRAKYCFHIVPMVNVDGVVHGNSRTTLAGVDPNRTWTDPNPVIHPEVILSGSELPSSVSAFEVFKLKEYLQAVGQEVLVETQHEQGDL